MSTDGVYISGQGMVYNAYMKYKNRFIAYIHDSQSKQIINPSKFNKSEIPDGYGAFFTVNGFNGRRTKENLTHINGVFADFDYKGVPVADMQDLPFDWFSEAPSVVNRTKNGYHCIWLLPESIEVTDENREELTKTVEGINRWFVQNWGADNAAIDVGHLLRIPNTEHRKNPSEPFMVTTVHESDDRYTLDELCKMFPPVYKEVKEVVYGTLGDDMQARLDRMLQRADIKALWDGDVPEDKQSETDLALCNHLAFWLAKDPAAMETAWLSSPKGQREKVQKRSDYRSMCIDKAIANTSDVYTPKKSANTEVGNDEIPERERYLNHLADNDWEDKDWVKKLKSLSDTYFINFYKRVAQLHPHLKYEIGRVDTFWNYNEDEGVYVEIAQPTLAGMIIRSLREDKMDAYTTDSQVRRIILNFTAYEGRGVKLDSFSLPKNMLHVKNGWLDLDTLELTPHTPDRLSLTKMDTDYDPNAVCPMYDRFLDEDSHMAADQVRVLDQFSGYILTDGIEQHTCLILEGRKGCGKSMLMEIWMNMLGTSAIPMQLTALGGGGERFIGQTLAYKNLCWFDEANPKTANINEFFQNLITGERIRIERKGIQGDEFVKNTLKVVLSLNEMPDHMPVGMDRRYRHIVFTRSFYEEGIVDPDYKEKVLRNEKSGILNRMVQGLHDLRKMGRMTMIAGEDERKREYTLTSDDFSSFLSDHFVPTDKSDMIVRYTYKQLRDAFVAEYPRGYNKQLSVRGFNKKLLSTRLPEFKDISIGKSNGERGYKGLKLKDGHTLPVYESEPIQVKGEATTEDW